MPRKIICIGQTCVDVTTDAGRVTGAFAPEGARINVPAIHLSLGGDATNVAIALRKLGCPAQLISRVGDDVVGECLLTALRHYGIDTSQTLRGPQPKAATQIFRFEDRARTLFIDARDYAPYEIPLHSVCPGDNVALCSLHQEPLRDSAQVRRAASEAKARGAIVCADAYTVRDQFDFSVYRDAFAYFDYFFPNDEEAMCYTRAASPEEACRVLLSWGVKNVVMKLGKDGCMLYSAQGSFRQPAFPVAHVVDTTGCGDHFIAGFLSALLEEFSPQECCRRASAAAAICTQFMGASTSALSRSAVEQLLGISKS